MSNLKKMSASQLIEISQRFFRKSRRRNITKLHRFHAAKIAYHHALEACSKLDQAWIASGYDKKIYAMSAAASQLLHKVDLQRVKVAPPPVHVAWFGKRSKYYQSRI